MKTPPSSRSGSAKPTLAQSARLHPYLPHKEALVNAYLNALDSDLFARGRVHDQRARLRESRASLAKLQRELAVKQAERRALQRELQALEAKVDEQVRKAKAKDTIVKAWRRYMARQMVKKRAEATAAGEEESRRTRSKGCWCTRG
ncbi:hypothetical protein BCR44DRAFT_1276298 [Catenaria anguillulae PL171]|uniref:Uncharacterized protein n=1 Tax=Catenaria anguillulae PL171 TaxID=765915 RepID=A0A1Y2H9H0_9FUNG|nr:hypothetical protein BCR44DRAFT_1276298 [Catenaria anguillulae PL171]